MRITLFTCHVSLTTRVVGAPQRAVGRSFGTCTRNNKTLLLSNSLPVMGEIAGVNTASLDGCPNSSKTMVRWAERFYDELSGYVFDVEKDGLCQVVLCS